MLPHRSPRPALSVLAATSAAVLASCGLAASAHAAPPLTSVTSPADGAVADRVFDLPPLVAAPALPGRLQVRGTVAAGAALDAVDLGCVRRRARGLDFQAVDGGSGVPVRDGAFAADVEPLPGACRLVAVPEGGRPRETDLERYAGPRIRGGSTEVGSRFVRIERTGLAGAAAFTGAGACGISRLQPISGDAPDVGALVFACSGALFVPRDVPAITVDGVEAHLASSNDTWNAPGLPDVAVERTIDPVTGDLRVTETSDAVRCAEQDGARCARYAPTGVRLVRTLVHDHDGRQVLVADAWTATDGRPHALDVVTQHLAGVSEPELEALAPSWRVPGVTGDAFRRFEAGTQLPVDPAVDEPLTVAVRGQHVAADGDPFTGRGAITWAERPTRARFGSENALYARFLRTVEPTRPATLHSVHSVGLTAAEVDALAAEAERRWRRPVEPPPAGPGAGPTGAPAPGPGPRPVPATVRVRPVAVTVKAKATRDRKAPYRYALSGRVRLPAGTPAAACRGVRVTVRVTGRRKGRTRTLATQRVTTGSGCAWRATVRLTAKAVRGTTGRLRATVTSGRTAALESRGSRGVALRAG